jgi:hypothetical protein
MGLEKSVNQKLVEKTVMALSGKPCFGHEWCTRQEQLEIEIV